MRRAYKFLLRPNRRQGAALDACLEDMASSSGAKGIERVLRTLLAEAGLIMTVDGYPTLADLTKDALRRVTTSA